MADLQPAAPSTARMIDYWLGGSDHFPIDVAAAHAFEGAYGPCAGIFRSLRRFLGRTVAYAFDQGVRDFLVFGAGIPSRGNVHHVVPEAHVLYTDADEDIVAHGVQLLAGQERAGYLLADATDPGLLQDERLTEYLPGWGQRPVGLVFLGLAAFLDDEQLAQTFDALYEGVPVGSLLIVDFDGTELSAYPEALAMMGDGFHMRDPSGFPVLLGRWTVGPDGIVPVARWRPDGDPEAVPDAFWGGIAVKG
jgi:hypothetical protein